MSIASDVAAAVAFAGYPVAQTSYDGEAEAYFVLRLDADPDDFADDAPLHDVWAATLHFFAPFTLNTTALRRQVRNALHAAGFTYPSTVDASESVRASDGTEQHLVFEFEVAEGINGD